MSISTGGTGYGMECDTTIIGNAVILGIVAGRIGSPPLSLFQFTTPRKGDCGGPRSFEEV
eukprot:712980-Rhodomonas_salina.2